MAETVKIGENITYQLQEGGTWSPHPSGNGIIAFNRGYRPLWVRVEDGVYRADWFEEFTEAKAFTELAWQKLKVPESLR